MPKSNPLFFFLKDDIERGIFSAFPKGHILLKKSAEGIEYAMIPIKLPYQDLMIKDEQYAMDNHHISIFSDFRAFSFNSEYHYTAVIKDKTQKVYKMHAYFSDKDALIRNPLLTSEDEGEPYSFELAQEDIDRYHDLITMHSASILSQIRLAQKKRIQQLVSTIEIDLKELFLLPSETIVDLEKSMDRAEKLIPSAFVLANIGGSIETLKLLQRYHESFEWAIADKMQIIKGESTIKITPKAAEKEEKLSSSVTVEASIGELSARKVDKAKGEERAAQQIDKLQTDLLKLLKLKDICTSKAAKIHEVMEYYRVAQEICVDLLDSPNHSLANKWIGLIHISLKESQAKCIERLTNALIVDDKATMELMKGFAPCISDNQIALAISLNKPERLQWILKEGGFCLNRILLDVQGKLISPLALAFLKAKPDCFRVLLENGASTFVEGEKGLPIAHHVFMQRRGPFFAALQTHIGNRPRLFFKQLTSQLQLQLEQANLADEDKKTLEQQIVHYQEMKEIEPPPELRQKAVLQHNAELLDAVTSNITDQELEAIQNDPAVIAKKNEYLRVEAAFFKGLSAKEKREILLCGKDITRKMVDFHKVAGTKITKEIVIEDLTNNIQMINLVSAQRAVAAELKKFTQRVYRKEPKEFKQLKGENKELMEQIERLKQTMGFSIFEKELPIGLPSISGLVLEIKQILKEFDSFSGAVGKFSFFGAGQDKSNASDPHAHGATLR